MTSDISHSFFQVVEDLSLSCLSELERPGSPSPRRSTQAEDSAQRPVDFRELSEWARVIPPFKLHYDLAYTDNILDILKTIEQELSTHTYIHDWDEKICPDPVKALALYAKNEMGRRGLQNGSHLINYSSVDRVCTVNGENYRMHVARDVQDVKKHFFESEAQYLAIENQYRGRNSAQPRSSYGRVTLIKESIQEAERSTLLLLHAFSIRLHNEDFTFIQRFVQRHLDLKAVYRGPLRFQDASPSYNISHSYRRLSISMHLPHLILQPDEITSADRDRQCIGKFRPHGRFSQEVISWCLYRCCSSVLLTLAVQEETASREKALDLLSMPEAIWTVLLVGAPLRMVDGYSQEPEKFLAPLTQFLRGLCGAIVSQRIQLIPILGQMRTQLQKNQQVKHSRNRTGVLPSYTELFDDSSFSKSELYHWIIKSCHEISESVDANLKFMRKFENNELPTLIRLAHSYEMLGLEHWKVRLIEELAELDTVQSEVHAFREQVRELRDALHGATAILDSRAAIMQGEKIKMLTYLSMAYLPIATVSSLYSMSVLPSAATFASFFIVLAVVMVVTLVLTFLLPTLSDNLLPGIQSKLGGFLTRMFRSLDAQWEALILQYDEEKQRHPSAKETQKWSRSYFWSLLRFTQQDLAKHELIYGLRLFRRPTYVVYPPKFSFTKFFADILRLLILPFWTVWVCALYLYRRCLRLFSSNLNSVKQSTTGFKGSSEQSDEIISHETVVAFGGEGHIAVTSHIIVEKNDFS